MNKYRCLHWFFAFALLLMSCQNPPQGAAGPSDAAGTEKKKSLGKLEFREELHNFGTVKEGETVSFSFPFKNIGGSSVRLNKVETGCGCLNVRYDQEEIKAGESSLLEVVFHSDGEWGNQVKMVDIATSSGQSIRLTIGAFVENKNINFDLNK